MHRAHDVHKESARFQGVESPASRSWIQQSLERACILLVAIGIMVAGFGLVALMTGRDLPGFIPASMVAILVGASVRNVVRRRH